MKLKWHEFRASLRGVHYVLRNIPWTARSDEGAYRRSFIITLLYRLGKSEYWHGLENEFDCGCLGYRSKVLAFQVDCSEHGLNSMLQRADIPDADLPVIVSEGPEGSYDQGYPYEATQEEIEESLRAVRGEEDEQGL